MRVLPASNHMMLLVSNFCKAHPRPRTYHRTPWTRQNGPVRASWEQSVTPIAPPTSANPDLRFLLYAALVTGGWSGIACLLIYLIGSAAGVPFSDVHPVIEQAAPVIWLAPLLVPLAVAVIAALLTNLLNGRRHARRITFWVGTAIAVITLSGPLTQPASVPWSARILLALMHVVTWLLVVPQLARIIGDSEPGMSVDRPA
mgnify:FL=1